MREHEERRPRGLHDNTPLLALLPLVVVAALALHRDGISWGDDWTLYMRQAESLYEGNVGEVIADNHFNVDNAASPGFSPYVYPWGFPLLLAPFRRLLGPEYEALRLVGVGAWCLFLWGFHAVVRRRLQQWAAVGVVAAVGTTLAYLQHTGSLLSELPFMASAALALWYLDHLRGTGSDAPRPLHHATRNQLVLLGLVLVWVFNVRREGLALVAAVGVAQLTDVWGERRAWRTLPWRRIATPFATWAAGSVAFQLLLPSAIAPEYADSGLHQVWAKLGGPYRTAFAEQLGFPDLRGTALLLVVLLVAAGVIARLWRAARADAHFVVFAVGTMTMAGSIFAVSPRYLMATTPFAVYFAAQAVASLPLPRRAAPAIAAVALALLTVHHVTTLADGIDRVAAANARGPQDGPTTPSAQAAFDAIRTHTHEDDVVAFFKARAMTYFTGRRSVQSSELEVVRQRADFSLIRKHSTFSQALVTGDEAEAMGWEKVWESTSWVLWRLPVYPSP